MAQSYATVQQGLIIDNGHGILVVDIHFYFILACSNSHRDWSSEGHCVAYLHQHTSPKTVSVERDEVLVDHDAVAN